jgi:Ca-activated chloride channel family protein
MDDRQLHKLFSDMEIPAPSARAEQEALAAARAEFARAEKINEKNLQGFSHHGRLKDRTTTTREIIMSVLSGKHKVSLALGSLGVLAIGVSLTMHLQETSSLSSGYQGTSVPENAQPLEAKQPSAATDALTMQAPPAAPPAPQPMPAPLIKREGPMIQMESADAAVNSTTSRAMIAPAPPPAGIAAPMPSPETYYQALQENRDEFAEYKPNALKLVSQEPVSTFSIDVDTASYATVRRALNNGQLPPAEAVRIEEMVNYFDYDYPRPDSREKPFEPTVAVYPTPWNKNTKLMHIGLKGYEIPQAKKPHSNLVFLIDTSGSMQEPDKLPLLQSAFKMLVNSLEAGDTISIVTYAGSAGVVLEPTQVKDKAKILAAIDNLYAGGSTAGAAGIEQAYALAEAHFDKEGVNRVMLATDGDFNVGVSDPEALKKLIEKKRESGVFLSVLGFGQGNYQDDTMQALAQNGNGTAAYIDSLNEARKVLVEEAGATLFPIAKDVKIQVEFNPAQVAEYRLLGYETRLLNREDFNNDKVDAGDVGSGHTVTAIYEITPVGNATKVDPLRYGNEDTKAETKKGGDEYAFLKLRYKLPEQSKSRLIERPVTTKDSFATLEKAPSDIRFAAAVAEFGLRLRGDGDVKDVPYADIVKLAEPARGEDHFGYRSEFLNLVRLADSLDTNQ